MPFGKLILSVLIGGIFDEGALLEKIFSRVLPK